MHTHIQTHTHTHKLTYIYIYMCVCVCVCIYMLYIYIYIVMFHYKPSYSTNYKLQPNPNKLQPSPLIFLTAAHLFQLQPNIHILYTQNKTRTVVHLLHLQCATTSCTSSLSIHLTLQSVY